MSSALWYPLAFLLALGILVTVHELGHFLAARACGVKVLRFSVGFGPSLFSFFRGRDRTEWSLGLIPLGGYVRMLDEREGEVPALELHRAFNRQSVGRRACIVAAGPLANLLLAVLIYWAMFMSGVQELKPLLAAPAQETAAAVAGIEQGWLVTGADGQPLQTWSELRLAILEARLENRGLALDLLQGDATKHIILATDGLASSDLEGDFMHKLGLAPYQPSLEPVVGSVQPGSPAEEAGLMAGDRILLIDGYAVNHWGNVVEAVRAAPGQNLVFEVDRAGRIERIEITPASVDQKGRAVGRMGAAVKVDEGDSLLLEIRYGPGAALLHSFTQTWDTIHLSLSMMWRMVSGQISWKNISGPVTIADYAGQSAKLGLMPYVRFIALISISLGVLNLLPIPVLDGGHLMYYLAEFCKGSPVSERAMEVGQRVGLGILGVLMAFALFNDFNRLFFG